ncbi:50S ribosomal protein L3 [Desulforegula conservatrix]|uniref:50S ribosomal protein L3 n=1 Tax=Desulforegula conservatrix TaxID=153026 RepID=UPI00040A712A|nr:50S ribosomal protein L3 [Desulforegula conservatrix]
MSKGMIGKKLGMTSLFTSDGRLVPVTVLEVGPCVVTQIKTNEKDGYEAIQIGFGEKKAKKTTKPLQGHFEKSGGTFYSALKEFRIDNPADYKLGQALTADIFAVGEKLVVSGLSKGRGFSGTIKRHGFTRGPETHGCRNVREPGSIGCATWPGKVIKGKKMPGRFGVDRTTVKNLVVMDIRPEYNVILVKGAVPGHNMGIVEIKKVN